MTEGIYMKDRIQSPQPEREGIEEWEKEFDKTFMFLARAIDFYKSETYVNINKSGKDHLKDIKVFIHQELQKAREEQNKHIGNQLLAYYENNVDPKGELKDKWFVKLVKNLADILVAPKDQSELDQPKQE